MDSALPLSALLRQAEIAADETVQRIYLRDAGPSTVCFIQLYGGRTVIVDAVTGKVVSTR